MPQEYEVLFNEAPPRRCARKHTVQFQLVDPSPTALLTFISSDKENFD